VSFDEVLQTCEEPGDLIPMPVICQASLGVELRRRCVDHHLRGGHQRNLTVEEDLSKMELSPHGPKPAAGTQNRGWNALKG
jgi:hypothetical protein